MRLARVRPPSLKPSTQSISLRLPLHMLDRIKAAANARDVPYQSLIKVWLEEKRSNLAREVGGVIIFPDRDPMKNVTITLDEGVAASLCATTVGRLARRWRLRRRHGSQSLHAGRKRANRCMSGQRRIHPSAPAPWTPEITRSST